MNVIIPSLVSFDYVRRRGLHIIINPGAVTELVISSEIAYSRVRFKETANLL